MPINRTKYFVLPAVAPSSGVNFTDFDLALGVVSLSGQEVTFVGSAGVDSIFVRPGVSIDFVLSGSGSDAVYLPGKFSDYAVTLSGTNMTAQRGADATLEKVTFTKAVNESASDRLIFADHIRGGDRDGPGGRAHHEWSDPSAPDRRETDPSQDRLQAGRREVMDVVIGADVVEQGVGDVPQTFTGAVEVRHLDDGHAAIPQPIPAVGEERLGIVDVLEHVECRDQLERLVEALLAEVAPLDACGQFRRSVVDGGRRLDSERLVTQLAEGEHHATARAADVEMAGTGDVPKRGTDPVIDPDGIVEASAAVPSVVDATRVGRLQGVERVVEVTDFGLVHHGLRPAGAAPRTREDFRVPRRGRAAVPDR